MQRRLLWGSARSEQTQARPGFAVRIAAPPGSGVGLSALYSGFFYFFATSDGPRVNATQLLGVRASMEIGLFMLGSHPQRERPAFWFLRVESKLELISLRRRWGSSWLCLGA